MLERLSGLPRGVEGLKAIGRVSKEDYEQVFAPMLDEAQKQDLRLRFLYEFGADFEGFTAGGAWEDVKMGLRSMRRFDGCAIVSDLDWLRESVRLAGFIMPCPVRTFRNDERESALEWLRSLPEGAAVSHRLLADSGVIVVDIKEALRAQDFDALAAAADTWIEAHGELQGLVIHARAFPGWENLEGLVRHVRFVRDHHRKIKRVALAVDSKLATVGPRIAEHFVKAELKGFSYDALDDAISWAGALGAQATAASSPGASAAERRI